MTRLQDLYQQQGQSPWLDNLRRDWIRSGELARWVERGVRGVTSNPSIFQKAIEGQEVYDEEFAATINGGGSVEDAYWQVVTTDISDALAVLRPVYDDSDGADGFVSVEVAPNLARDTAGTTAAARRLHADIDQPNLFVKIPGTAEGLPAIRQVIADGKSVNITLLFSLQRYDEVIEAYLSGLEAAEGSLAPIASVASFFVSRVDTEVDKRLDAIGTEAALALRGKAAVANAQLAYQLFVDRFSGDRWEALAARGARVQRPLWASTSTKNPDYSPTLYVDELVGPDTVNTLAPASIDALREGGGAGLRANSVADDPAGARKVMDALADAGVDFGDVTDTLEREGVSSFAESYKDALATLERRIKELTA